jgi:hypothetical protein
LTQARHRTLHDEDDDARTMGVVDDYVLLARPAAPTRKRLARLLVLTKKRDAGDCRSVSGVPAAWPGQQLHGGDPSDGRLQFASNYGAPRPGRTISMIDIASRGASPHRSHAVAAARLASRTAAD